MTNITACDETGRAHCELSGRPGHLSSVTGLVASAVPRDASDAELVHAALDGDTASFSVLLDRYRAGLYARALGYLGRPEDAADAVQETFLLALYPAGSGT